MTVTRGETAAASTTRERVLRAAADLLAEGGRDAVSTRAVSAAAGVQAPTLYRLFGDKEGLLQAVAAHGFAEYLSDKHALAETDDPIDDLRRGWDLHVGFGLSRPEFYVLMYGDIRTGATSPAARESRSVLHRMVSRIAAVGRLRMSVERAAQLVHGASMGLVLSLIATPHAERDLDVLTVARENVLRAISEPEAAAADVELPGGTHVARRATGLRAALREDPGAALTDGERGLLAEWLDRLGGTAVTPGGAGTARAAGRDVEPTPSPGG
jgi:AcrR family transcriptional regulator